MPPSLPRLTIHPRETETCPPRLIHIFTRQLVEFNTDVNAPPYAILSHRWEDTLEQFMLPEERESLIPGEVSYKEYLAAQADPSVVQTLDIVLKSGYKKIQDACSKALELGLEYIWIDTCCIDRDSPTDMARNIRSMYSYYRNSAVCLVYLYSTKRWNVEVTKWFKRGWTLLELLAPKEELFFNEKWTFMGSRSSRKTDISKHTGIPEKVLDGTMPIDDVDVQQRLSWIWGRKTTKPVDLAYCLMGLLKFDLEPDYNQPTEVVFGKMEEELRRLYPTLCFSAGFLAWSRHVSENWNVPPVSSKFVRKSQKCPLRFIDARTLRIETFSENQMIPPYAILSHRWIDGQEITLREYQNPLFDRRSKSGFSKIQKACFVALQLKLNYLWTDTCCIDQDDPIDKGQNIGSMFSYYQNSVVCLAYIFDVKDGESSLAYSKWFTRGWTLQELVAPAEEFFFDKEWTFIGTRSQLTSMIYWVTGIEEDILRGGNIYRVHARNRIGWARGRETTQAQDMAYCLLGILGVELDVDYAESIQSTFQRLEDAFSDAYPEIKLPIRGLFLFLVGEATKLPVPSLEKVHTSVDVMRSATENEV
ncbi:hypothetical protein VKT23_013978 [Stygiomarasmius scandens]|uniref:Heterokaryon incompatibility domain-containing protein n=1 Tax=Marasmiellus scandens TaxID=2682957 RepID=A0ABR1J1N4_9AGAR